jgi:hypothetical protein
MLISQYDPASSLVLRASSKAGGLTPLRRLRCLEANAGFSLLLRCYCPVLITVIPSFMPTARQDFCGEPDIDG